MSSERRMSFISDGLQGLLPSRSRRQRWAEDLDFLGSRQPAAWWAWALLALGVLAVVTLSLERQNLSDELERAESRLRQAQRFEHQAEMRAKLAAAQAAESAQQARQQVQVSEQTLRAATKLVQQLAYPWADVLGGVEQASGEVALLGLRHDVQSGEVHLDAAVRDDLMALKWVDALSADRAHFAQAYLQSREPLQQPVGELATRVQLVAVLSPRIDAVAAARVAQANQATEANHVAQVKQAAVAQAATQESKRPAPTRVAPTRVAHVEAGGRP
jgi:hypothetical protein